MNDLQQVERIKIKLRLAKNTDPFFEKFGAESHRYYLKPPLELKVIEAFEQDFKIQLPICYKTFLSEVGNGGYERQGTVTGNAGAGPGLGIYGLGHYRQFIADPSVQYLEKDVSFNFTSENTPNDWNEHYAAMDENISDDDYEAWVAKVYSGILIIGYSGCSNFYGIILNGTNTGRVLYTYDEMQYSPHPVAQKTFLDFYENWLDKIIDPQKGGRFPITEQQCLDRLLSDKESYWKKVSLTYFRQLETVSVPTLKKLGELWVLEGDPIVRMYFLCLFVKFDYEQSKRELEWLSFHQPMDFLRLLHLYAPHKTREWSTQIQEIQQKVNPNSEIIEYLKYLTLKELGVNEVDNNI